MAGLSNQSEMHEPVYRRVGALMEGRPVFVEAFQEFDLVIKQGVEVLCLTTREL